MYYLLKFVGLCTVSNACRVMAWLLLDFPLRKCQMRQVAPVEAQPAQGALDSFVSAQAQEGDAGRGAEETHTAHREVPACDHWRYVK